MSVYFMQTVKGIGLLSDFDPKRFEVGTPIVAVNKMFFVK